MTDDKIKEVFEEYGRAPLGKEYALIHAIAEAVAPQRTWSGLTDKDWNRSKHNYDFQKGVDWAESILKEKNA
jgi:phosphoribulokinase